MPGAVATAHPCLGHIQKAASTTTHSARFLHPSPQALVCQENALVKNGSYEPIMICWDFVQVLQKPLSAAMGEMFQYLNCSVLLAYWSTLMQTLSIRLLKLQCVNSKKSKENVSAALGHSPQHQMCHKTMYIIIIKYTVKQWQPR